MSNHYKASQGITCALVTRHYADEHPRVRVEGDQDARLAMAERIAAMLNGEEDPEIVRLRKIIEDTNNVLFDGCHYDEEEIDHEVQQHNANASDIAKKLAKINQKALDLVSAVVMDLVGG